MTDARQAELTRRDLSYPGLVAGMLAFYAISLASGAALGADMTLPPAMLAARIRGGGARVFSLWTFLQKTTLAVLCATVTDDRDRT